MPMLRSCTWLPSHLMLPPARPAAVPDKQVPFLVGPRYMHWSSNARTEPVAASMSVTSLLSQMLG